MKNAWSTVMYPPNVPTHTNHNSLHSLDEGRSRTICRSFCSLPPFGWTSRTWINCSPNVMDRMAEYTPTFIASSIFRGSIRTRLRDEVDHRYDTSAISCSTSADIFMDNCAERI